VKNQVEVISNVVAVVEQVQHAEPEPEKPKPAVKRGRGRGKYKKDAEEDEAAAQVENVQQQAIEVVSIPEPVVEAVVADAENVENINPTKAKRGRKPAAKKDPVAEKAVEVVAAVENKVAAEEESGRRVLTRAQRAKLNHN
jgi:hypothetical protein